jgi:2-succinyl-5-enolpyruvyl-6-hydroxy-3-cyclohexene-1-carboxylate synthase
VQAPIAATAEALRQALGSASLPGAAGEWPRRLGALCAAARAAVGELLHGGPTGSAWGEGVVARAVAEALPDGALLALGNSLPVRSMEVFAPPRPRALRVWSQRGLAGIDGLVSGVAGSLHALAAEPSPPCAAALLVGDVSFQHDLGGLATLATVQAPLAIVVVQNHGGRIFEQLPLAGTAAGARAMPHFVMPQSLDVAGAAAAFGLPCTRVASLDALTDALRAARSRRGASIVEAVVPEHAAAAERTYLRRAMAAAVDAVPVGMGVRS